jgi:hypothetical protein
VAEAEAEAFQYKRLIPLKKYGALKALEIS